MARPGVANGDEQLKVQARVTAQRRCSVVRNTPGLVATRSRDDTYRCITGHMDNIDH
jgi:hypothetical protein